LLPGYPQTDIMAAVARLTQEGALHPLLWLPPCRPSRRSAPEAMTSAA
jgi:hypothetical protein